MIGTGLPNTINDFDHSIKDIFEDFLFAKRSWHIQYTASPGRVSVRPEQIPLNHQNSTSTIHSRVLHCLLERAYQTLDTGLGICESRSHEPPVTFKTCNLFPPQLVEYAGLTNLPYSLLHKTIGRWWERLTREDAGEWQDMSAVLELLVRIVLIQHMFACKSSLCFSAQCIQFHLVYCRA